MSYKILTTDILEEYILNIPQIREYLQEGSIEIDEIGDGNLNFVYRVTNKDTQKSLIVKQAVPYLRIAGEGFPLSRDRMSYEIRALTFYEDILEGSVPKVYYADEDMSLVIMQNLSDEIIMRKGLIDRVYYPRFVEDISDFLAKSLFYSSSLYLSSSQKRELIGMFNANVELCKLTEDFVFTNAFIDDETNDINPDLIDEARELFGKNKFKKEVLRLKYIFMTQSDALLHGDLHTGSIMISDKNTFVIDPEFAFVGAFGFDIGALIANMINSYISHTITSKDEAYREWILESIEQIYTLFHSKFITLWSQHPNSALLKEGFIADKELREFKEEFMSNIFTQSIGFAGCKIARRVFGIAGVEEIRGLEDKTKRRAAELLALKIGERLIVEHRDISCVKRLITIIKEEVSL